MKSNYRLLLTGTILFLALSISSKTFSQRRLPDGTIIYNDGSRRLPNGTITYPRGTNTNNNGVNRTIDGILHPNNNNPVYTNRYPRRTHRTNNHNWMPPGQAKKIYGGNASDYAPGHNKGRWNKNEGNDDRNDHGKGHHKHD